MELTDLRYTLAMDRIREIPGEHLVPAEYEQYFEDGAKWFLQMEEEERFLLSEETQTEDLTLLQERNRRLYEEILPENYGRSWANPEYAAKKLGSGAGPYMAALRYEMRSVIPFVYRHLKERVLISADLEGSNAEYWDGSENFHSNDDIRYIRVPGESWTYPLTIGGIAVTDENCQDVFGDGTVEVVNYPSSEPTIRKKRMVVPNSMK